MGRDMMQVECGIDEEFMVGLDLGLFLVLDAA